MKSILRALALVVSIAASLSFAASAAAQTIITGTTLRVSDAPASSLWLDAAKTSSISTIGNAVAQWNDAAGGLNFASQSTVAARPNLTTDNAFAGPSKSIVDFGANMNSGQTVTFNSAITDIRSVFWVMKGSNFLLGSTASANTYDFHRGDPIYAANAPLWHNVYAASNIQNGQTYVSGTSVNGTTTGLSGNNYQMIDLVTTGTVQANALANDRGLAGRQGGQQIGEVIIFNTALTDTQRQRVETYLNYKWFGSGAGVGNLLPVNTAVTISGGGTLDLSGENYQTVASLASADPTSRVTLGGAAFTVNNATDTTFAGVISDTGTLTKDGAGKLTLTGANTYTGLTTISNGTLELNSSSALTLSISGSGALTQAGAGTTTLIGTTGYTGSIAVNGGKLVLFNTPAFQLPTTVTSGGTLAWSGTTDYDIGSGATVALSSGGTLENSNPTHWVVLKGAVTTSGATNIKITSNATGVAGEGFYLDGGLLGTGTVTISATNAGSGVNFRNNNSNFSGSLIVNGIASTTPFAGSGIGVSGASTALQNADITLNGTMELLNGGIGWAASTPDGIFGMGALSGTGVMVANFASTGGVTTVTLGYTNNNGSFSGQIADGIGNTLVLVKTGLGTQTLSGTNTYTGTTTVNVGTLLVNGSISGSVTTVNNGGTLGGSGTVGAVTVASGGTLAPGNSIGILTATSFTQDNGAHLAMEINGTTPGTNADAVTTTTNNALTLAGDVTLTIGGGYSAGNTDRLFLIINNGTGAVNGEFSGLTVIDTAGTNSYVGTEGTQFAINGQVFQLTYQADFGVATFGGNDVALYAIPEPQTWAMLLGGFGMLVSFQRMRRRKAAR